MNNDLIEYFSKKNILYIEDEKDVRDNVKSYLELLFLNVEVASDGEEALRVFDDKKHDVILTDLEMPKISGLEFVHLLREQNIKTPVIVMSAHTSPKFTLKATELKLVRYLVKPFDGDLFLETLEKTKEEIEKQERDKLAKYELENLKTQLEETKELSKKDFLTGLLNREALEKSIKKSEEFYVLEKKDYGIIFIDIDFFKKVNDTYGHIAGDKVLAEVGKTIIECCKDCLVGRFGGEEFVVVCQNYSSLEIYELAERIRKDIERQNIEFENNNLKVTASLGVSLREKSDSKEEMLAFADQCMYRAKESGRNRTIKELS